MTVKFIFRVIPIFVFYTDFLVWKGKAGASYGVFIVIRPQYRDDIKLLEHELIHCRVYIKTLSISGWLYMLSEKWRVRYEAEAYLKTLGTNNAVKKYVARKIHEGYNIKKLSYEDVEKIVYDYANKIETKKEVSF